MNSSKKHDSPLADTFKLADDILIPFRTKDSLFGYVNKAGEMVIEPQWPMAYPFSGTRAPVLNNAEEAIAMIDREGNYITDFKYTRMAPSGHPGHWQVQLLGGQWGIIDTVGNEVIPIGFERMGYIKELGWYLARLEGKLGYVDATGKIILPFEYERLEYINRDGGFPHIWCKKNGRYLYLDTNLHRFIQETFDESNTFIYGRAWVQNGDRNYLINTTGEEVLDLSQYAFLINSHPEVGIIARGEYPQFKYGLININSGEELETSSFHNIDQFHEGHAVASIKDSTGQTLVGIINDKGEWTVEPQYEYITYYYQNQFKARRPNEKQATELINAEGKILFSSEYQLDSFFDLKQNEFLKLLDFSTDPSTKGVIDYMGNEILPIVYQEFSDDAFGEDGLIQVKKDGIYYYVDIHGNEYIQK
ncbi:hypothetical protein GCM10011506_35780 [Marivirga lumbricoides]|uniref:WG repeat-containing protein n=1 Tax=Marivirga lumbricoides TaxID=1046115 RepID=A0ABQ1MUE2_9BACT|nr:hypothetical protein GCM10011506_35780 [Marivirga lumbricoides]